ncbi:MAG: MFS transporter [Jatrophihabitans sp.]
MGGVGVRVLDAVAPPRFGRSFRWLLASSWLTNLGDGIGLAAGPLLMASLTNDAFLISLAALAVWAPPLLFGLYSGVLADRLDRRRLVVWVNIARAAVLVVLTVAVFSDVVTAPLVLMALFAVGTAEVFADNTSATLLPMLVRRDDLAVANSRMLAGVITINQLAGPAVGAALFALGSATPFGTEALVVALGALLASRMALPPHGRAATDASAARLRHEIAEGVRWVRHHPAVRTLVLTIFIFNITFGAAWSVLVLYATRRLGLGEIGFGLLTSISAAGGVLGSVVYARIVARISLGDIMRIGLIIETLTHLALALTRTPWIAYAVFFVFGAHAFIWGTTSITVRQRAVPTALQGRVTSVNQVGVYGGLVIGSGIGGLLAQRYNVTAPFWFAFAGSAVFVVVIWRQLRHISLADDEPEPEPVSPR